MEDLLKKSGYSERAIEYYKKKVNVGKIENPSVSLSYTGHCGDTLKIYLKIDSDIITEAKFEATGCAGAFSAASALMVMVKGRSIVEAEKISEENIIEHLGSVPETKVDCVCLARMSFQETLKLYKEARLNS